MTKQAVKKSKRKSNTRLKKAICTTMSAIFMISSIAVAAIPVENLQATTASGGTLVSLGTPENPDNMPEITGTETVYTSEDGMYQFVYVNDGTEKVADLVGYSSNRTLPGGVLSIPETIDGYLSTPGGYIAANVEGKPLYFKEDIEEETDEFEEVDVLDEDGNPTGEKEQRRKTRTVTVYHPCYYNDTYRDKWYNLNLDQFYYYPSYSSVADLIETDTVHTFQQTTTDDKKWVKNAPIRYIASKYVEGETAADGSVSWKFYDSTETGVFSKAANVVTLRTSSELLGIGKNAFRNCSSLSGIELSNGTMTIHNYAFADCINMQSANIDLRAAVQIIGEHAFLNCKALRSFTMPIAVQKLGDGAFEGCTGLKTMTLTSDDYNVALQEIGDHVFKDCQSLERLTIPEGVKQNNSQDLRLSLIQGCTGLKSVTTTDRSLTFAETDSFSFNGFLATVSDEFYFAGYSSSSLHDTATEYSVAFKYLDSPYLYEKVVEEINDSGVGTGKRITYRVDEDSNLKEFVMDPGVENVDIPRSIGPYKILSIGSDSFRNNCYLKKITIPSSIVSIEDYAFQGCHNLKDVIYEQPINLTTIGTGAFDTQIVQTGKLCDATGGSRTCADVVNEVSTPVLTFTGSIDPDSVPFSYAMDPANNINRGTQKRTYITFFSGWPTNLTVQYNPDTNLNELINYPSFSDLLSRDLNVANYPYLTTDQINAAEEAVAAYQSGGDITQDQSDIINSALNVVLPKGIEGVKEGIFSGKDEKGDAVDTGNADNDIQSIRMEGVSNVPAYAFYGCQGLQSVIMRSSGNEDGDRVGDYAFGNCDDLTNVTMSDHVVGLGLRPFKECDKLTYVNFEDSPYFVCDNGIIYGLENGKRVRVVECLETRGNGIGTSTVSNKEMEGIESIQDEAFMDCTGIGDVNLEESRIKDVPVSCFENATKLFSVELPDGAENIKEFAFRNSGLGAITIPDSVTYIDPQAFANSDGSVIPNVEVTCAENSTAEKVANNYSPYGWKVSDTRLLPTYVVMFFDSAENGTVLDQQRVRQGDDAVAPEAPVKEGYNFTGWRPEYTNVSRDLSVYPYYDQAVYVVRFFDWDRTTVIQTQRVLYGEDAFAPAAPELEGFRFTGWSTSYTNVTEDTDVYPNYEVDTTGGSSSGGSGTGSGGSSVSGNGSGSGSSSGSSGTTTSDGKTLYTVTFYNYDQTVVSQQMVESGKSATTPVSPTRPQYRFTGWMPSYDNVTKDLDVYAQFEKKTTRGTSTSTSDSASGTSDSSGSTGSGSSGTKTAKTYVVTVENGSGSGSYTPGSTVSITAFDFAGRTFTNWAASSTDFLINDVTATTATFTMPEHAVNVVAKYTTTTTSTGRVAGASASGNTTTVRRTINNGTRVDITKSGISNRDVASASVSGSSDNFVVKISDDESAKALVEQALLAEYGNLDNIKYFAMDISLYDSTGQNKINNTDGLSVTVTMPIPDALVPYAGNNKTASVLNGKLDKLTPRFTTIDGVPCVSFVAKHFSPYTVYVDTANLTAGTYDSTPKTGDPIHPKWFLAIGLAILSVLMFGAGRERKKIVIEV